MVEEPLTQRLSFIQRVSSHVLPATDYCTDDSIGPLLADTGKVYCWALRGPALRLWEALQTYIVQFLSDQQFAATVCIVCHVCGKVKTKARPTVIIWGGDKPTRRKALRLLKEENVIDQKEYSTFLFCEMVRDPALQQPRALALTCGKHKISTHGLKILMSAKGKLPSIIRVTATNLSIGTLSGPVLVKGEPYFFTSAHVLTGESPFDSVSEECLSGEGDALAELFEDDEQDHLQCRLKPELKGNPFQDDYDPSRFVEVVGWLSEELEILCGPLHLDYALVPIPRTMIARSDTVYGTHYTFARLPTKLQDATMASKREGRVSEAIQTLFPPPSSIDMFIELPDRGILSGRFLPGSIIMKQADEPAVQHIWIFAPHPYGETTSPLRPGDSGLWVASRQSCQIWGHVVAGDAETGRVLVMPSCWTCEDIDERFGPVQAAIMDSIWFHNEEAPGSDQDELPYSHKKGFIGSGNPFSPVVDRGAGWRSSNEVDPGNERLLEYDMPRLYLIGHDQKAAREQRRLDDTPRLHVSLGQKDKEPERSGHDSDVGIAE
ncbi:hypothetical protein AMS68_005382 [Peltaster fructicola]|uniref:Uncharacterized protein n=1 Tax=Peltaster fructicola TaxID=286661 RepID=A0A6H0XYX1_9PEZI|nr:hypothetical protein AMS68_005382 [Peltaster fructicola]